MKINKRKGLPGTLISLRYAGIAFGITIILMIIIPKILNYGPESINTPFDVQMSNISYNAQFSIIAIAVISFIVIGTKLSLRDLDKYIVMSDRNEKIDQDFINKVRTKCLNLPYIFLIFEAFAPSAIAILVLSLTGSHSRIMIGKIIILLFSFSLILAVASFIFTKNRFDEILSKTYKNGVDLGHRIILKNRIFMLILPIYLACIFFMALIGYASSVIEKEDVYFDLYSTELKNTFDENIVYTESDIIAKCKSLKLYGNNETIFYIKPDGEVVSISEKEPSYFSIEYLKQIATKYDGHLYESYGNDAQGSTILVRTDSGNYYVAVMYEVISSSALVYIFITGISLIAIAVTILTIFGNSLSKSLHQVYFGFKNIITNSDRTTTLPVVSNDEIGDLVLAFNDIQKINTEHIEDIQNKQNMLIERERLASLGQMIGGVAHSLKTPIFSISGGIEGLNDLVEEFDSSIEDPTVNDQDMHDIAQDMRTWLQKMKGQLTYMSEVITTVKGQAVNLSGDDNVEYTIGELFSHTSILMKHELQSALVGLNIENNVPDDIILNGNINNLVQVLNNLISNAIQAYTDEPKKEIDLKSRVENNNIIITIKDYGPGLPEEVENKLFKEMITTKGKAGTGLGVFMSYSMIKGKFNGDIKYTTGRGKGTQFDIYLPY